MDMTHSVLHLARESLSKSYIIIMFKQKVIFCVLPQGIYIPTLKFGQFPFGSIFSLHLSGGTPHSLVW